MNKWFESSIVFATLAGFFIVATSFMSSTVTPLIVLGLNSLILGNLFVIVALTFCAFGFVEQWYKELKEKPKSRYKILEFLIFWLAFIIPYLFLYIFGKPL
jgi:small-conductance mechanosensitive channel